MIKTLKNCLKAKKQMIWIRTTQEKEVLPTIINCLIDSDILDIYTWSVLKAVEKIKINKQGYSKENLQEQVSNPIQLLNFFNNMQQDNSNPNKSTIIFRDYDELIGTNPMYKRFIKEITEQNYDKYIPMIFISSSFDLPIDLIDSFSLIDFNTPSKDDVKTIIEIYHKVRSYELHDIDKLVECLRGFYTKEIIETLDEAYAKSNSLDISYLNNKKIELINKTNLLTYENPTITMNEIGGNKRFKKWYEEVKYCFNPDAEQYGIDKPKGYLALGIAGCAKSLTAKAIASDLQLPYLELDMSKLLSSRVGESEQKVARAVELIKSSAPCVLLIDEVEKNLGGKQLRTN